MQSLVDEGAITEADVATDPYRSLLLRALDGRTVAEPDLAPLETYPGDRYLLCSDGLSGVVSEQTLHQVLASVRDLDEVTSRLVGLWLALLRDQRPLPGRAVRQVRPAGRVALRALPGRPLNQAPAHRPDRLAGVGAAAER